MNATFAKQLTALMMPTRLRISWITLTVGLLTAFLLLPTGVAAQTPVPTCPEFQVNTTTFDIQQNSLVAMDADGDFVVTWREGRSSGSNGPSTFRILAQRYNAAGVPQGAEFQVSLDPTIVDQQGASVAMDADGDFVIAWVGRRIGEDFEIYAQRYNAAGVPQGAEFQVNTYTSNNQLYPTVAMDADGDFVITWTSEGQDSINGNGTFPYGIYAQRYNATGIPQGAEFQVNTYTDGGQQVSTVAMDADGDFVITWSSAGQDGSGQGMYAQRYDAAGIPQGTEFQVNTYTDNHQMTFSATRGSVALDADGDFVVTWTSEGQDGSGSGIYAQRYNAAGVAQGAEFQVNTFTANNQRFSIVAMDAGGNFVITWTSTGQDEDGHAGDNEGVYAQYYNAAGVPQGAEFQVNTSTRSVQRLSTVAMDADGDFVITWSDPLVSTHV